MKGLIAAVAALIFVFTYRVMTAPRVLFNGLRGWSALAFCLIGIPAAIFGVISFLDGLHLPAVVIFVSLCVLWLIMVRA